MNFIAQLPVPISRYVRYRIRSRRNQKAKSLCFVSTSWSPLSRR